MSEFTSADVIMLIHKATLELYGIEMDASKTTPLPGLIRSVANGERTFIDSAGQGWARELRAEAEAEGIDMDEIDREARRGERNAARSLSGMPPIK
ncbi:hypothetical protein BH10PLA1_BH10PLA1_09600 [soil metagenome]